VFICWSLAEFSQLKLRRSEADGRYLGSLVKQAKRSYLHYAEHGGMEGCLS
jgi:hypothetical protein